MNAAPMNSLRGYQMQYEAQHGKTETVWNRFRAGFWATKRKKDKLKEKKR